MLVMLAFIEALEANIDVQLPPYPPIEKKTFIPKDFHVFMLSHGTGVGKLIVPSEFMEANATITSDALALTSFVGLCGP